MAEPIEIIIRKGTGGDGTGFGVPGATPGGPSAAALSRGKGMFTEGQDLLAKSAADSKKVQALVTAYGIAQVKRYIGYSLSQHANKTGNYIQQADIQMVMNDVNWITGSISSIATSAAINPYLGIATAIMTTGSKLLDINYQYQTFQTNLVKLNTYNNIMMERSGGVFSNGSRGTDY